MAEEKPSRKSSSASKIAACVLVAVNVIVLTLCALMFAVCLWAIASPSSLSLTITALGGNTLSALVPAQSVSAAGGAGGAALAVFLAGVACMGLHGALTRSHFQLFMYSSLIFLLLLLECALLFYFTSTVIEKGLRVEDGQWAHYTRLAFKCCDFNTSTFREAVPPWSCCGVHYYPTNCTAAHTFTEDCIPTISDWLDRYGTAMYTSLTIVHFILLFCSLLRRRRSASRSHS